MIFLVFIRLSVHPAYSPNFFVIKKSNYQETLTSLYTFILIVYQHEPSLKFKKVKLYSMLNWVRIKPVFYYLILFKLLKSRSFSILKRVPVKPIKGSVWIYDRVVTNVGNAYNPSTGKFVASPDGIYQFNWYTLSNPQVMSHAGMFVIGVIKARQASNKNGGTNQFITADSSIALLLKKGDEVYIIDVVGYTANLRSQWTAFGGVLIN